MFAIPYYLPFRDHRILRFHETPVFAALGHELLVRAAFDDPAMVDDADHVGILDRAQSVRDDETRASDEHVLQRRLQCLLGAGVDVARRLVENEDARVGEQRARTR